ncbi:MAG: PASTA domain-containing protein [Acidothermaceae bacterium]
MITEDGLRDAFREQVAPMLAELQPDPGLLDQLRRRQVRRNRLLIATTTAAVVVVAGGAAAFAQLTLGGDHANVSVGAPTPSALPNPDRPDDVNLVATGRCAGLTLAASYPGVQAGISAYPATNTIALSVGQTVSLTARGPCSEAVTYHPESGSVLSAVQAGESAGSNATAATIRAISQGTQSLDVDIPMCAMQALGSSCLGGVARLSVISIVAVSSGHTLATIPDTVGLTAVQAVQVLQAAGFTVIQKSLSSSVVGPGGVLMQTPVSGVATVGTAITIEVSAGALGESRPPGPISASVPAGG